MSSLYASLASLTLIVPFLGQLSGMGAAAEPSHYMASPAAPICQAADRDALAGPQVAQHSETTPSKSVPLQSTTSLPPSASNLLEALHNSRTANQVRIKRSVTIRITPYRQGNRNSLLAQLPRRGVTRTFEEGEMAECVPVSGIAGVQTSTGNRLLLFLRDERIISLNLERGCEARDFYSGFYVERNEDGRLCVKRDQLQSRSGAKCEVAGMKRLVRAGD